MCKMCRIIIFKRHAASALYAIAALAWLCGIATADLVDRIVVVVNDEIILLSDLEQECNDIQPFLVSMGRAA